MQPCPQLTPDEHRSIRNWSFAMAVVYSFFMLTFFASVIVTRGAAPSEPKRAAAGLQQKAFRTTQSPDGRQPPTDATMQR